VTRNRKKIAIWKSRDGRAHALDASCTHKGCAVTWNNADQTWNCPCHGSIFSREGAVLHGPATEPLKPARVPAARSRR
jgi:Rieske Fe-S protein